MPTDSRLLSAAERGDVESVSNFLSAGADVNWQNEHGETALIYAAWGGYEAVVAALLHHPPTAANIQVTVYSINEFVFKFGRKGKVIKLIAL